MFVHLFCPSLPFTYALLFGSIICEGLTHHISNQVNNGQLKNHIQYHLEKFPSVHLLLNLLICFQAKITPTYVIICLKFANPFYLRTSNSHHDCTVNFCICFTEANTNFSSASPVLSLIPEVGPSPNIKLLLFQLSV